MDAKAARQTRARAIVDRGGIRQKDGIWYVPSQSRGGTYKVELPRDGRRCTCTCPDYVDTGMAWCKHIFAAEIEMGRLRVDVDSIAPAPYEDNRDWAAVNAAYINEREHVLRFASELCAGIQEPARRGGSKGGRKPVPLRDIVLGGLLWVYSTKSTRDSMYEFKLCQQSGLLSRRLSFSTMMRRLQNPALTPLLRALLRESALPFRHIERRFAIDATSFSTCCWANWNQEKWGRPQPPGRLQRKWLKVHAICGTDTRIVTDCTVAEVGDAVMFSELVKNTAVHFNVEEISADGAYASFKNTLTAEEVGAIPLIPVEDRVTGKTGPDVWREMVGFYRYREADFRKHYHQRSNIETVFSQVKRKFGGSVRSKKQVVQENEILLKFILHNFRVLVMGIYDMGEEPHFFAEKAS